MQRRFPFILPSVVLALAVLSTPGPTHAQSNPFNPDFAWCNVQGSVATRGAAIWQCLQPGVAGQVLQSGGPAADAAWLTVAGTGSVTSVSGSGGTTGLTLTGGPITTAGTLTLGGTLGVANGGTGLATFVANDMIYATSATTLARLPAGASNTVLKSVSGVPTWVFTISSAIAGAGISVNTPTGDVTFTNTGVLSLSTGTTGLTGGGTGALTLAGTLAVPNGGTGQTTYTNGQLLIGNTTGNTLTKSTLTAGSGVTVTNGTGTITLARTSDVTSVTCGTGLTGGTITTTGTCTLVNNTTAGEYPGTATTGNATAGNIGEEVIQTVLFGSGISQTSGVASNIAAITLTAGDWDLSAQCYFSEFATTPIEAVACSVGTVSAAFINVAPFFGQSSFTRTSNGFTNTLSIAPVRITIGISTNYFLVSQTTFTPGAITAYGTIRARRMR